MTLLYVNAFHIAKVGDCAQRFKRQCKDNSHPSGRFFPSSWKIIIFK